MTIMTNLKQNSFKIHIDDFNRLLNKVRKEKSPGTSFYKSGARAIIFRLGALCRIYRKIDNRKTFDKWYKIFKELEDLLGSMDHNEAMLTEFSRIKPLKDQAEKIFGERFREQSSFLETFLHEKEWLNRKMMRDFANEIDLNENHVEEEERKMIALFLISEMNELEREYRKGKIDITHLESGIHEFRRKLRWLSIYAVSLNGLIQLRKVRVMDDIQSEYCVPEIVNSPFNILPAVPKGMRTLQIQSTPFYSLSWLIQYLGELKDCGLRKSAFDELLHATKFRNAKEKGELVKKYSTSQQFDTADISVLAEYEIDSFLYSQRILKTIERDLNRNIQSD